MKKQLEKNSLNDKAKSILNSKKEKPSFNKKKIKAEAIKQEDSLYTLN
ncbi:hypothetical protein [Aliivibrio fischeri]|uniref:Uncharacterized protein n=1 Tax=Aliivibrio fischeri SR5 TaxID=1088719 RepID=A0AAV3ETB0_ALIFS|nr:hypothetical protein [Aliivibrio fischeri]EHN69952.1 hypothetical protein VFSR5_1588 [Aliivibrio fischeri SR5]